MGLSKEEKVFIVESYFAYTEVVVNGDRSL